MAGFFIASTLLGDDGLPTKHIIHSISNISMYNYLIPALLFDNDLKRWRGLTLLNTFLSMTASSLLITECYCLNATDQIREGRVDKQVTQRVTMSGSHKLDTAFCYCAGSGSFQFSANLVNDDNLWHVIFHSL